MCPIRPITLLFGAALSACSADPAPTDQDKAQIRQSIRAMTQAFNDRDDPGLAAVAMPDADWVTVTGRWTRGTAAYANSRRSRFDGPLKNARIRPLETHIRFVRPDVAVVHVSHEMSGMTDEQGHLLAPHEELSTRVYLKHDRRWRLTAFHNSSRRPPAKEH